MTHPSEECGDAASAARSRLRVLALVAGLLFALSALPVAADPPHPAEAKEARVPAGRYYRADSPHSQQSIDGIPVDAERPPAAPPVVDLPAEQDQPAVRVYRAESRDPVSVGHVGCPGCREYMPNVIVDGRVDGRVDGPRRPRRPDAEPPAPPAPPPAPARK